MLNVKYKPASVSSARYIVACALFLNIDKVEEVKTKTRREEEKKEGKNVIYLKMTGGMD
jgi:hypothetical protein